MINLRIVVLLKNILGQIENKRLNNLKIKIKRSFNYNDIIFDKETNVMK